PSSSAIWEFIEEPRSVREICQHLCQKFEISEVQCEDEVKSHLSGLIKDGLVELIPGDVP
ncbi:MAG: PqqD family peptide modification chaperone, partial [Verrucomicrobiota bacterium]